MSDAVVLDAGPLGLLSNPNQLAAAVACRAWAQSLRAAGRRIIVAEIADFEVRRELIRARRLRGLAMLDALCATYEYLPLTTFAMRRAAEHWAQARNAGMPTAAPQSLDADVILAGQAEGLNVPFIVATDNIAHLARFVPADHWSNIVP